MVGEELGEEEIDEEDIEVERDKLEGGSCATRPGGELVK